MPAVARLGDASSHGGHIISASPNVLVNGIGVARNGDAHSCPLSGHGTTALIASRQTRANGQSIVCVGDLAGCGAVINQGSPNTNWT